MRQYITKLRYLFIILAVFALLVFGWLGAFEPAHSAGRPTPTACRAGVEGKNYCPDGFQTSVARPGDFAPRRGTPTKPKR
jgi:hypothetical protein